MSQKDVIEFLKQVGIEYQLIDPKVFGDFLHKLGVDVPRLTVDDIFEIIAAQTVEIDTSSLDRAVVQEMVDAVNEEADFVVDAEGVIGFAVELGLSKDDLSSREILNYLETRGFLVNNPDTVLENVGIDTEAVRDQFSDIGVDADEILAGMTDPSVKLDVKEISKEWDNYTPAQVLE